MTRQFSGGRVPPELLSAVQKCVDATDVFKQRTGLDSHFQSFDIPGGGVCHVQNMSDRLNVDVSWPEGEGVKPPSKQKRLVTHAHLGYVLNNQPGHPLQLPHNAILTPVEYDNPYSPDIETAHFGEVYEGHANVLPLGWPLAPLYPEGVKAGLIDWRLIDDLLGVNYIVSWHGTNRYADRELIHGSAGAGFVYLNGHQLPDVGETVVGAAYQTSTQKLICITTPSLVYAWADINVWEIAAAFQNNAVAYDPSGWQLIGSHGLYTSEHSYTAQVTDRYDHWKFDPTGQVAHMVRVLDSRYADPVGSYVYTYNAGGVTAEFIGSDWSASQDTSALDYTYIDYVTVTPIHRTGTQALFTLTNSQLVGVDYTEDGNLVYVFWERDWRQWRKVTDAQYSPDPNDPEKEYALAVYERFNDSYNNVDLRAYTVADGLVWEAPLQRTGLYFQSHTDGTVDNIVAPDPYFDGILLDYDARTGKVISMRHTAVSLSDAHCTPVGNDRLLTFTDFVLYNHVSQIAYFSKDIGTALYEFGPVTTHSVIGHSSQQPYFDSNWVTAPRFTDAGGSIWNLYPAAYPAIQDATQWYSTNEMFSIMCSHRQMYISQYSYVGTNTAVYDPTDFAALKVAFATSSGYLNMDWSNAGTNYLVNAILSQDRVFDGAGGIVAGDPAENYPLDLVGIGVAGVQFEEITED